jgi:hypothetical protein
VLFPTWHRAYLLRIEVSSHGPRMQLSCND